MAGGVLRAKKVLARPALSEAEGPVLSNAQAPLAAPSTPPANHTWKVYYYAGAQMIALRELTASGGNTLYFLHADQLGSTSATTCGNTGGCGAVAYAGVTSRQTYFPYGGVRSGGGLPTSHTFTGQIADDTGLMFYNARYYSSYLARFISADTIVPGAGNPQAFNRYAYTIGNPLKYIDPSGHEQILCDDECENNNGSLHGRGLPVSPMNNSLTDEQYVSLGVYAESSDGTHPNEAITRMAWVVWNNVSSGADAYKYITTKLCDKVGCSLAGLVAWVLPKGWKWSDLSEGTLRWALAKVYKNHVNYQPFIKVQNIVRRVSMDKALDPTGSNDPTNGSTMFNHASVSPRVSRGWHKEPFPNPSVLKETLRVNFDKYKGHDTSFTYSLWDYPSDWGLVLVTGNRLCVQGANDCGAYLP